MVTSQQFHGISDVHLLGQAAMSCPEPGGRTRNHENRVIRTSWDENARAPHGPEKTAMQRLVDFITPLCNTS